MLFFFVFVFLHFEAKADMMTSIEKSAFLTKLKIRFNKIQIESGYSCVYKFEEDWTQEDYIKYENELSMVILYKSTNRLIYTPFFYISSFF